MSFPGGPLSAATVYGQQATLVCLSVPPGTNFGLDVSQWTTGAGFSGLKGVPPGFHAVHTAPTAESSRATSLWWASPGVIHVLRWDAQIEALAPADEATSSAVAAGVRRLEFDAALALYPPDDAERWRGLTRHVTASLLGRVGPAGGTILADVLAEPSSREWRRAERATAVAADPPPVGLIAPRDESLAAFAGLRTSQLQQLLSSDMRSAFSAAEAVGSGDVQAAGAPPADRIVDLSSPPASVAVTKAATPQTTAEPAASHSPREAAVTANEPGGSPATPSRAPTLFFLPLADPRSMTPAELSAFGIDSSAALMRAIAACPTGGPSELLGELELAYALACGGQSLQAFEAWKARVDALCRAEDALLQQLLPQERATGAAGPAASHQLSPAFFAAAFSVLETQLRSLPRDFFTLGDGGDAISSTQTAHSEGAGFLPAALTALARTLTRRSTQGRVTEPARAAAARLLDAAVGLWGRDALPTWAGARAASPPRRQAASGPAQAASTADDHERLQLAELLAQLEDDADGGDLPTVVAV